MHILWKVDSSFFAIIERIHIILSHFETKRDNVRTVTDTMSQVMNDGDEAVPNESEELNANDETIDYKETEAQGVGMQNVQVSMVSQQSDENNPDDVRHDKHKNSLVTQFLQFLFQRVNLHSI